MHAKGFDLTSLAWSVAVAIAYVAAADVGFALAFATKQVTAVWPPTGIALAALLLRGPGVWPGILVGAFVSNVMSGGPVLAAAGIAIGNTAAPMIGYWLLKRAADFDVRLRGVRDIVNFVLFGVAAPMTVSATNGVINLALAGIVPWPDVPSVWVVWWVGDAMGALLVAPALMTIAAGRFSMPSRSRVIEGTALCAALIAVTLVSFSSDFPLAYPVFPIVIWIALRFGQREGATAVLLASAVALWQTVNDQGPFVSGSLDRRMIMVVTFMAVLALTALILGALTAERKSAEAALRKANDELQSRFSGASQELQGYRQHGWEERLRDSEEQFRSAFETAAHGMSLVSLQGRWLRVNKALCDIVGYGEQELLATDFQTITHPEDLEADLTQVRQLLDGTIDSYQMEKRYIHKQGHVVWILLSVSLVKDRHGAPVHFVSQIIDINRRKRVEQALIEAGKAADAANRAKDRFLAVMSHELRTPMTGVLGMADLLLTTNLTAEQKQFTHTLARSARGLLNLLNDILDFSKIEAGQLQVERAPLLLSDVLRDISELFSGPASEKGLTLQVNYPPTYQDAVIGDVTRIKQVISNLVSNAIKFTSTGGVTITMEQTTTSTKGLLVKISVADTGVGISEDTIKRLFQPFAQADASITRKFGGTGLGLVISRNLARAMGGEIEISSHEGAGATFTFSVQLERDTQPAAGTARKSPVPTGGALSIADAARPLNVLLAEDTATTRILITAVLTKIGHTVSTVEDGAQAVAAVAANSYDIVLMDMQMPIMDGPEAIAIIRKREQERGAPTRLPIIALTADVRAEGKQSYLAAGADAFAGKPIDWAGLAALMDRLTQAAGTAADAPEAEVAAAQPLTEKSIIDAKMLEALDAALGPEALRNMLTAFAQEITMYREKIATAVDAGNLGEAKHAAHTLKGLCGSFGASRTGLLARSLELEANTIDDMNGILPALTGSIDDVREALRADYQVQV